LVNHPGEDVPRLLVNRERVGEADARVRAMAALVGHTAGLGFDFDSETNRRDALFLGDCDDGFRELARLLGWDAELETLVEAGKAETRGGKDAG
jgi:NAD-dependent deacetylase sirtuin 2